MPALLLHMTVARQVADHAGSNDDPVARAARAEPGALLLGSIWPDLPYHARFGLQLVRHLLRRRYRPSEWGDVLHSRGTGQLALAMLSYARRVHAAERERQQAIALAAGYLCHCAMDTIVHPEINRIVAREGPGTDLPADAVHAEAERVQSLLYHHEMLGYDITGSAYPIELVGAMTGAGLLRPRLDDALWQICRAAMLQTHGRCPTAAEVGDWLWGVTAYAHLMGSSFGRRSEGLRGDLDQLRTERYRGPTVDLATPLQRAIERTLQHWRAAADLLAEDRLSEEACQLFGRRVPDVDLNMGLC